jgi:hypothetical protein
MTDVSHDPISLVGGPLVTLSALMLFGRLVPILVLWWMATTTRGEDSIDVQWQKRY